MVYWQVNGDYMSSIVKSTVLSHNDLEEFRADLEKIRDCPKVKKITGNLLDNRIQAVYLFKDQIRICVDKWIISVSNKNRHYSKIVAKLQRAAPSSWLLGRSLEVGGVFLDTNTTVRNTIYAMHDFKPGTISKGVLNSANIMGTIAAPVIVAFGAVIAYQGVKETLAAKKIQDWEGVIDGVGTTMIGGAFSTAGVAFGGNYLASGGIIPNAMKIASSVHWQAVSMLGVQITVGILYLSTLFKSLYDLWYLSEFRRKFNEAKERGSIVAFRFLVEQSGLNCEGIEREQKWAAFCRRVGESSANELKMALQNGDIPTGLIDQVCAMADKENYKLIIKRLELLMVSIVGLAAVVASRYFPPGAAAFYAVTGILWLLMDSSYLHDAMGNLAYPGYHPKFEKDRPMFHRNDFITPEREKQLFDSPDQDRSNSSEETSCDGWAAAQAAARRRLSKELADLENGQDSLIAM